jgi:rsbT antagonist protein RsbS
MPGGSIPILKIGKILLATIQVDLHDTIADAFQNDVLEEIEKTGASGLIVDISALESVDSYVARILANTGKMAKLMGAEIVIVGMRPAVAATLVRMGYFMSGVRTALNLQEGLEIQSSLSRARDSE